LKRWLTSIYNMWMKTFRPTLMVDVRRLRVLRELKARSTIGATAKALHLTPSAISQQIAALSRDIGAPLLMPHGRGVRLTPQSLLLLGYAAQVDTLLERARGDLLGMEAGAIANVAIGGFATAISGLVAPALTRLSRERPGIHLSIEEIQAPECFTDLDRGDLDMVITVDYASGPHRGDVRYYRQELLDDPLLVAVSDRHVLARRRAIDLRALATEQWIVGATHGPCREAALAACGAAGFNPEVTHRVNDWNALLDLVAVGCGVALIPRLAVNGGVMRGVTVRPLAGRARPSRHIYAAVRAGAERSPATAATLSALAAAAHCEVVDRSLLTERPLDEASRRRTRTLWQSSQRRQ
jgi:DNA-binding transcriptional LysR family regulator